MTVLLDVRAHRHLRICSSAVQPLKLTMRHYAHVFKVHRHRHFSFDPVAAQVVVKIYTVGLLLGVELLNHLLHFFY